MGNCSVCKKDVQIYQPGDKCLPCLNDSGICGRCGRERIIRYKTKGWCTSCYQSVWETEKRKGIDPVGEDPEGMTRWAEQVEADIVGAFKRSYRDLQR